MQEIDYDWWPEHCQDYMVLGREITTCPLKKEVDPNKKDVEPKKDHKNIVKPKWLPKAINPPGIYKIYKILLQQLIILKEKGR